MLIVHLFVSYAHCVTFSLPPGVSGWLRLLLVALPGLFYLPFVLLLLVGNIILTKLFPDFVIKCAANILDIG